MQPMARQMGVKMRIESSIMRQLCLQHRQRPLYPKHSEKKKPTRAKGGPSARIRGISNKIPMLMRTTQNLL